MLLTLNDGPISNLIWALLKFIVQHLRAVQKVMLPMLIRLFSVVVTFDVLLGTVLVFLLLL